MSEYNGLFLPKEILCVKELNLTEKILLSQIIPLCVSEPCYASNQFFAERLGITETTVSTTLKSLDDKGYIQTFLDRKAGNKRTIEIFYYEDTLFKIFKDPYLKTLNTLFKNLKDPLKNSYTPYLKNLKTLFKNLNFIYKDESKEESKDYSKEEIYNNESKKIIDEVVSDKPIDDKKEKEKSSAKKEKDKRSHGEHNNVFLTDDEVQTLVEKYGVDFCNEAVDKLSNFLLNKKANYYKSHYGAINQWVVEAVKKDRNQRQIQENIISKTVQNGNRETSQEYLKRVGSGLDKIFEHRFGKSSNVVANGATDDSCEFAEFNFA